MLAPGALGNLFLQDPERQGQAPAHPEALRGDPPRPPLPASGWRVGQFGVSVHGPPEPSHGATFSYFTRICKKKMIHVGRRLPLPFDLFLSKGGIWSKERDDLSRTPPGAQELGITHH